MLIAFASEVGVRGGRVLSGAAAVVHHAPIRRRIERLFIDMSQLRKGRRVISVLRPILFVPALYLSAAARFEAAGQTAVKIDTRLADDWSQSPSTTPEQAPELQSSLEADPDNLETRTRLLFYYRQHRKQASLWIRSFGLYSIIPRPERCNYLTFLIAVRTTLCRARRHPATCCCLGTGHPSPQSQTLRFPLQCSQIFFNRKIRIAL